MNKISKRSVSWLKDPSYIEVFDCDVLPDNIKVSSAFCFMVNERKEVLFIKNKKPNRSWEAPGGHVEQGKSVEECVIRECQEESYMTPSNLRLFALYKIENLDPQSPYFGTQYQAFYIAKNYEELEFKENDEIEARSFSSLDNDWCKEYPELISLFKKHI